MLETESYIIQCRTNWFLGIRPSDKDSRDRQEYKVLIKIAQAYFAKGQYEQFSRYFIEGHYLIPLWTAHLILEYGKPMPDLKARCIEIIISYTDNPLAPDVAIQERKWLDMYNNKN